MSAPRASYWKITLALYAGWIALFYATGSHAAKLPAIDLSTWLDSYVPFVPRWVWVYFLCYLFPALPIMLARDWHQVNITLLCVALVSLAGFAIHLHFPTSFARPVLGNTLSENVLGFIHKQDFPPGALKFPSLHVAIAWLIWYCIRHQDIDSRLNALVLTTTVAIVGSTLFTRQHILVDVLGGTLLAFIARRMVGRFYQRHVRSKDDPLESLIKVSGKLLPMYLACFACVLSGLRREPEV